jgi:hypothetical protein
MQDNSSSCGHSGVIPAIAEILTRWDLRRHLKDLEGALEDQFEDVNAPDEFMGPVE